MKKFAIIIDEDNSKRVVPSKWLSADRKILQWPSDPECDIKKCIITQQEPDHDWDVFEVKKFIKSNGKIIKYF